MAKWNSEGRICSLCKEFKKWNDYSWKRTKRHEGKDVSINKIKQPKCKSCSKELTSEWRNKQTKERLKHLYLINTYGLSYDDFLSLLKNQNYNCKICDRGLDINIEARKLKYNSAVVDHDHITGKVRGILCNECNRGLGYFHDNKDSIMNAIKYLTETESSEGGECSCLS